MAISLQKGGNVNLSKEAQGLTKVVIGLGWDPRSSDGSAFDLDGSAFLLKTDGKVRGDSDFIFYNNLKSTDGSVVHTGDNTTGQGDGDDGSERSDEAHTSCSSRTAGRMGRGQRGVPVASHRDRVDGSAAGSDPPSASTTGQAASASMTGRSAITSSAVRSSRPR